jgi:hypothetical protein
LNTVIHATDGRDQVPIYDRGVVVTKESSSCFDILVLELGTSNDTLAAKDIGGSEDTSSGAPSGHNQSFLNRISNNTHRLGMIQEIRVRLVGKRRGSGHDGHDVVFGDVVDIEKTNIRSHGWNAEFICDGWAGGDDVRDPGHGDMPAVLLEKVLVEKRIGVVALTQDEQNLDTFRLRRYREVDIRSATGS